MLTCKEASRLVSEGQDRKLALRERLGLRLHLWMCTHCRRFEQQIRLLRRMSIQAEVEAQEVVLTPEARERIRKAVVDADTHTH
jgi:predicted anti-sigma-YlaC factor YlaD